MDSILSVLVTDGVDVTGVAHAGRTIPTALRRALAERDPVCVVPGCDSCEGLEIDHVVPFGAGGKASMENLVRLCHWHHYLKTHHRHRLEPDAGGWRWIIPDEPPSVPPRILRSGPAQATPHAGSSSPSNASAPAVPSGPVGPRPLPIPERCSRP